MSPRSAPLGACLVLLLLPTPVIAQGLGPSTPSYGYPPYNDRNPTGFLHPNNMGYGQYVYSPKTTGRRAAALKYRRFRGY